MVFANVPAASKDYALHQAVLDNDLPLVKKLLLKGAAIDVIGSRKYGYGSALHLAVRERHVDIVKLLLDRGAEVDVIDPDDFTPLHNAAWNGNLEMVKLLMGAGADIEASTYDGDTPLKLAQNNDQAQVAEFILKKLAAPSTVTAKVETQATGDAGVIDISGIYTTDITYSKDTLKYNYQWSFGRKPDIEISIEQQGNVIIGVISGERSGEIEGILNGNEITYEFYICGVGRACNEGNGTWLVSDSHPLLSGTWKHSSSTGTVAFFSGEWKLTKVAPDISGTFISETITEFRGGGQVIEKTVKDLDGNLITIKQTGNTITGSDSSKTIKINGTRAGNIINFYIIRGNEIVGSWAINADATEMVGEWKTDGGGGASGKWNLTKVESEVAQVMDVAGTYVADISGKKINLLQLNGPKPKVRIVQDGAEISGTFESGGKIWGDIKGDTIEFEWHTPSGNQGRGKWTFKPGGNSADGTWIYHQSDSNDGNWNLTKIE